MGQDKTGKGGIYLPVEVVRQYESLNRKLQELENRLQERDAMQLIAKHNRYCS